MTIFNRWGEIIFVEGGVNTSWDGTYKFLDVEPGVYAYLVEIGLESGNRQSYRGIVTLVR
jgi:hypothetical protein